MSQPAPNVLMEFKWILRKARRHVSQSVSIALRHEFERSLRRQFSLFTMHLRTI